MASKNRKNKVKFKWTKELIILLVLIVAMITATIVLSIPSKSARTTTKLNNAITANSSSDSSSSTNLLPDDNVYVETTHKELLKKIGNDEYVYVLYGSLTDSNYTNLLYGINSKASQYEVKTVCLYSSDWVLETDDTDSATFKDKASSLSGDFSYSKGVVKFDYLKSPAILVFHNGEMVMNSQEYDDNDSYNWNQYINKALTYALN